MNNRNLKVAMVGIFASSQLLLGTGCDSSGFTSDTNTASSASDNNQAALASSLNLTISQGGNQIYGGGSGTISLTAGQTYNFAVSASNLPSGSTIVLVATDVDVIGQAPTSQNLVVGNNSFTPAVAGDYAFKLEIMSGTTALAVKNYQASIVCQHPTFTANSLNAGGIQVAASGGSNNMFTFNAANVVSGANGQAPYLCAYDVTGVSIVDTAFTPCATTTAPQYSNYVGDRKIGVVVKDACNTSYAISANPALDLAYNVPAINSENVFIYGQVSNESGSALIADDRIDGVTYLATNQTGFDNVQSTYSGTTFQIASTMNYGQLSSVTYGMQIKVTGLSGTFNLTSNVTGTIVTTGATVSAVSYSTDQAGDQLPATSVSSTSCTSSNITAKVLNPVGTPCASGLTGSNNSATVEVSGDYVCSVSGPEGSATITGSFDGLQNLVDSCIGGSGQSGGGIVPIAL